MKNIFIILFAAFLATHLVSCDDWTDLVARSHWVKNIMQHSESTSRAIMPFHSDGSEVGQIKVQPPCTTV